MTNNCRIDSTWEALKDPPIVVRTFARKGNDDHKLADQVKLAGLGSQMSSVIKSQTLNAVCNTAVPMRSFNLMLPMRFAIRSFNLMLPNRFAILLANLVLPMRFAILLIRSLNAVYKIVCNCIPA